MFIHEFPLPVITTVDPLTPLEKFFSDTPPEPFQLNSLTKYVLPPKSIIKKLIAEAPRQWQAGKRSFTYAHLAMQEPRHLPLGVLGYWKMVMDVREMRILWLKAEEWIRDSQKKLKLEEDHQLAEAALRNFDALSWSDSLNGFTWSPPVHSLTTYLGTGWLTSDEMDQMIRLLIHRLSAERVDGYELQELGFTNTLLAIHRNKDADSTRIRCFDRLGNALTSGICLRTGGFAHVRGNHWIGWIFDSQTWTVHYADSQQYDIDGVFYSAIAWWLGLHSDRSLQVKYMSTSIQVDSHSCGPLSFNALEHFIFSDTPLIPQSRVQVLRYQTFLRTSEPSDTSSIIEETPDDVEIIHPTSDIGLENTKMRGRIPITPRRQQSSNAPPLLPSPDIVPHCRKRRRNVITSAPSTPSQTPSKTKWSVYVSSPSSSINFNQSSPPTILNSKSCEHKTGPLKPCLLSYFKRLDTREALIEQNRYLNAQNRELLKNLREMKEEEMVIKKLERDARMRDLATLRQRKMRMRKQSEKDVKKPCVLLKSSTSSDSIAENSRPFRELKEHLQKGKKKTGHLRKKKNTTRAIYVNWFTPLLWIQIQEAGKRSEPLMSPADIVRDLKAKNPLLFGKLTPQVLGRWIDDNRAGKRRYWSDNTLRRVQTTGNLPQSHSKCPGILRNYPNVVEKIKKSLSYLREAGTPLTLITIRAIFIAHFECHAPEIFQHTFKNGRKFKFHCTDSFVKRFLHDELQWSWRRATQAAQKLPADYKQCEKAVLRIAWVLKDEDIPAALFVNSDQTGIVYAQGADITWGETGSKQISVVGGDEKRAFTLVPSIAADGTLLPFQAVYKGKSSASLPSVNSPKMKESLMAGFVYSFSGTDNHWSSHETMHELVDKIIAPYFERKKKVLGLPLEQKSLWYIDCWSLHRSEEFRTWMTLNHPNIIILYVPANCTGILQPCDGGIQRPLKLCIKRASHEDLIHEIMDGFEETDIPAHQIRLTKALPVMRNRSTRWIYEAFCSLNHVEVVKKAFEGCRIQNPELCHLGELNLSYECLTSFAIKQTLRNLHDEQPDLYREFTNRRVPFPKNASFEEEDNQDVGDVFDDESDLTVAAIFGKLLNQPGDDIIEDAQGNFCSTFADEETSVEAPEIESGDVQESGEPAELGRGKRQKRFNTKFTDTRFWVAS